MKNPVLECINTRRSVRDFLDKPVPKDMIEEILHAAVMAPSARNRQPCHFTIVEGPEKITYYGKRAVGQYGPFMATGLKVAFKLSSKESIFYNAPLLIIVSGPRGQSYLHDDVNLAVENMFLAAHALGLGSCWIGLALPLDKDEEARKELGIPKEFEIVAPLIFGFPKEKGKNIPKREVRILKWIK